MSNPAELFEAYKETFSTTPNTVAIDMNELNQDGDVILFEAYKDVFSDRPKPRELTGDKIADVVFLDAYRNQFGITTEKEPSQMLRYKGHSVIPAKGEPVSREVVNIITRQLEREEKRKVIESLPPETSENIASLSTGVLPSLETSEIKYPRQTVGNLLDELGGPAYLDTVEVKPVEINSDKAIPEVSHIQWLSPISLVKKEETPEPVVEPKKPESEMTNNTNEVSNKDDSDQKPVDVDDLETNPKDAVDIRTLHGMIKETNLLVRMRSQNEQMYNLSPGKTKLERKIRRIFDWFSNPGKNIRTARRLRNIKKSTKNLTLSRK